MLKREADLRAVIAGLESVRAFVDDIYLNTSAPIISYDMDRVDEQIQDAVRALRECIAHESTDPHTSHTDRSNE